MGFVYIIKNTINDKLYVGCTGRTVEVRWKDHLNHVERGSVQLRLYVAMGNMGAHNFSAHQVYEHTRYYSCEAYVISYLETCNPEKGYNDARMSRFLSAHVRVPHYLIRSAVAGEFHDRRGYSYSWEHLSK